MTLHRRKESIVEYGRQLIASGLTTGTGGNLSILDPDQARILITPSGVAYDAMSPADVVVMDMDGGIIEGRRKPSSEWNFHVALYRKRPDIHAVVHTHSVYATTLACLHWEIPALWMIDELKV
ncbi:Ribulose-5-phosphate 4-epimerase and related epimerases and aldolases [Olavius algarvensis associated proteobacterium Delta 3]|nr:Ribulose-5-phosphate 4-epimerase and related epimerases and aldolases [Olavius algarvensis associated proteobacterium Delta 3]